VFVREPYRNATLVTAMALASCATPAPSPVPSAMATSSDPCHGIDLDVDRIAKACAHTRPKERAPGPESLRVEFEGPTAPIRSGESGEAVLRFRNVSGKPLAFQLEAMCGGSFGTHVLRADGSRADVEEDVGGLGLCDTVPGVRVELEPGGILTKRLTIAARAQRWVPVDPKNPDGPLELVPGSPIAPGTYTLEVRLPLYTDPRRGWQGQMRATAKLQIADK
jgi:hypothetical protein